MRLSQPRVAPLPERECTGAGLDYWKTGSDLATQRVAGNASF